MMHIVIFPTWACQLSCVYCSIRNSGIDRSVKGVPWQRWAEALPLAVSPNSIIDIAGGEPFLYAGLLPLLHSLSMKGLRWAITTNALATATIDEFCLERPRGGICVNVSDHEGNPEAHENIVRMRKAGYQVNAHRVNHEAAGRHEPDAQLITYQDWKGGKAVDGKPRHCTAGRDHWIAGPNGDLWRCIVATQTGQPPAGNLFTRDVKPTSLDCDFGCSACYTEDPASWMIEMKEMAWATI